MKTYSVIKLAAAAAVALLTCSSAWANFGGTIYCDANCNGKFDGGDAVLGGVTVQAYACGTSTLVGATTSAADGSYSFEPSASMPLGTFYYVCVIVPSGYN